MTTPDRLPLRSRLMRWDIRYSPYLYIAPFFLLFAAFGLFPIGYTFWVSLTDRELIASEHTFIGLQNYRDLLGDDRFWNALRNTAGIFVLATVPQILLALGLAHLLNAKMRARTFFRVGILLPYITSVATVAIIFSHFFARDFGMVNWLLGLVGVDPVYWQTSRWSSWLAIAVMVDWRWTGYNALIFLAAMQTVPRDLYEAAAIDGAGAWRQFWRITIPTLRPTIIFVVVVSTIFGMQLFAEPLLFDENPATAHGGSANQFQTVVLYLYQTAFKRFDFGYAAAIGWVLFLIIIVVAAANYVITRRVVR